MLFRRPINSTKENERTPKNKEQRCMYENAKTTKRDTEVIEGKGLEKVLPPSKLQPNRESEEHHKLPSGLRGRSPSRKWYFGYYRHNFVRFHACFSSCWTLTGKADKTEPIRPLFAAHSFWISPGQKRHKTVKYPCQIWQENWRNCYVCTHVCFAAVRHSR